MEVVVLNQDVVQVVAQVVVAQVTASAAYPACSFSVQLQG